MLDIVKRNLVELRQKKWRGARMDKNEEVPVTYEIFKFMSKGPNWREIEAEEKRMNDLLKEWQERLGLQSWKIDLRDGVKQTEFQSMEQQGECEYDTVNSCAVIRIAKPEDCTGRILPFDKEKTLVHELLHIKMWFIYESDCDLQSKMVHQLIDDMARALVDAKKSGKTLDYEMKSC
jgi:hypothetical protein